MRSSAWVAFVAVMIGASVAHAGDDGWYKGPIIFKAAGDLKEYATEKEACTSSAAMLTKNGNKQTYSSFKAGTKDDSVTCILKRGDDGKTWDQVDNVSKIMKCNGDMIAVTKGNTGKFADLGCRCDPDKDCPKSEPIHPPVEYGCKTPQGNPACTGKQPPRCTQQPASPMSTTAADAHSKVMQQSVNKTTKAKYDKALKDITEKIREGKEWNTGTNQEDKVFPTFGPKDMCETGGPTDINIGMPCGTREADFAAANNIAGLGATPSYDGKDGRMYIKGLDCVWHHHEEMGRMQLVQRSAHGAESHTGGVAVWKQAMGVKDYPLCCPPPPASGSSSSKPAKK